MSLGSALQAAVAQELGQIAGHNGVFDGPPARAPFPYVVIDTGTEADWSHKSGEGREVLLGLTIWDDQPSRLRALADEVEHRVSNVEIGGPQQLVSLRFLRRRMIRDVAGPWAATVDFRARLLAN